MTVWPWNKTDDTNESGAVSQKQYQSIRVNEACGDRVYFTME
ncbi:hypothetical protein [Vibrio makurazakiensis]